LNRRGDSLKNQLVTEKWQPPFPFAQGRLYADRGYYDLALLEFELARKIAGRSASSQSILAAISEAINDAKKVLTLPGPEYLVLRRAEELDAEQIHHAHMKSINEICSRDHSEEEIKVWGGRKFDPNFRIPAINEQFYVVVECEGQIEGFCQLKCNDMPDQESFSILQASSITYRFATGPSKGKKALVLKSLPYGDHNSASGLVAKNSGFSLHAGVATKAQKREELEKICRYIARPALSEERLSTNVRGEIIYRFKKPWSALQPSFHDPKSI
jgi:hypothetical protein